ncbi:hydrogenase maturation protease [Actinoplanes sp. NPDC049316]|uniref:hydrogenase maturation protease n=1 Tax=Actinoplanes sp. NPDC049316 TaxID=3154727 RepID=UPI003416EC60
MGGQRRRVIVGIGNEYRSDDAVGPLVIAELLARQPGDPALSGVELRVSDGDPAGLLMMWAGAEVAVVVDAVRMDGAPAGHLHELVADDLAAQAGAPVATSHAIALGETVALGRALGRLPRRLVVLAVCGKDFGFGTQQTPEVAAAVQPIASRARDLASAP